MTLPSFEFSFFDMDQNFGNEAVENLRVRGHTYYSLTNDTVVAYDGEWFSSNIYGVGADNPTDPLYLTEEQRNKAVSFTFNNTASFDVTYRVTQGGTGRNFFFAGKSNIVARCYPPSAPPPRRAAPR